MSRSSPITLAANVLTHHLFTKKPFLTSYKLTYRCNLRCQQCPFVDQPGPEPSFAQVCAVLDLLQQRGSRIVIFEGGEPLLWHDGQHGLADIARYAQARFAVVGATTNGTLPLDVPTDLLWVSVDGFAETHNQLRGANIFDQVIKHIRISSHPRLYAHITANAANHTEIPALIPYLAQWVKGITVQFYYPYGSDSRLFLPWPERRKLLEALIVLKRQGQPVLNSIPALRALMDNSWRCQPWRIDCANPDGSISQGCYLLSRAPIDCTRCGFSPYTEISLAFQGRPAAVWAGMQIFTR